MSEICTALGMYTNLVGKIESMRLIARLRSGWKDNIKCVWCVV